MSITSCLPNVKTKNKALACTPVVYYFDTVNGLNFIPEEYVDITDFKNIKVKMLSKHKTQLEAMKVLLQTDLTEIMKNNAVYRGQQCNVKYAEVFKVANNFLMKKPQRLLP